MVHPERDRDVQRQDGALAQWGPAVAKNPFLAFKFKGGAKGEKIQVTWTDNRGDKRTEEAVIS
jgi:sulfur-oxidizing protein SoxZ